MENVNNLSSIGNSISELNNQNTKEVKSKDSSGKVQNDDYKTIDSPVELVKKQFNRSILSSHLKVSVNAGNKPMSLLFKAAIDEINLALEDELGENAIQNAYNSGVDVSPEATAERIVSTSTAFYAQYRNQNPELSDLDVANKFIEVINGGIDTGFSQAREVLDGLNVLEGDIADNIDATYELVQEGLKSFVDSFQEDENAR